MTAPEKKPLRMTDWAAIRHEYEAGEYSVEEILERHGIGQNRLYKYRKLENWQARRPAHPRAFGAGGTVDTTESMTALVESALAKLLADGRLVEKIDLSDPLRALHTLIHAFQKIRDIKDREKRHDDGERIGRLIIDDASREALARRLDELARAWRHERDSRSPEAGGLPAS